MWFWIIGDHKYGDKSTATLVVTNTIIASQLCPSENKGLRVNEGDFSQNSKTQTDWLTILQQLSIETIPKQCILMLKMSFTFLVPFAM